MRLELALKLKTGDAVDERRTRQTFFRYFFSKTRVNGLILTFQNKCVFRVLTKIQ